MSVYLLTPRHVHFFPEQQLLPLPWRAHQYLRKWGPYKKNDFYSSLVINLQTRSTVLGTSIGIAIQPDQRQFGQQLANHLHQIFSVFTQYLSGTKKKMSLLHITDPPDVLCFYSGPHPMPYFQAYFLEPYGSHWLPGICTFFLCMGNSSPDANGWQVESTSKYILQKLDTCGGLFGYSLQQEEGSGHFRQPDSESGASKQHQWLAKDAETSSF